MARHPQRLHRDRLAALCDQLLTLDVPRGFTSFVAMDEDIPALVAMSIESFGTQSLTQSSLSFYLHKAHAVVFGLKKGRGIAAYCVCELNAGQSRIYVVETCTAPECRGQGLGLWLRARVDDIALHLGYRHIASHVAVTNTPALRMNEKAGMAVLKRLERYYDDGRDAFYLRKTLAAAR